MKIKNEKADNYRIVLRVYWSKILVAIYGFNSESEFYTRFINEMDDEINMKNNFHLEVERNF